jgi:thiol-disulfide isomerase/thioredoxin
MIAFISNHCPDSHAAEGRVQKFLQSQRGRGLAFVAINPNHPDGLSINELGYSKYNDGFDDMKKYAAEAGFDFPYLYDGETQAVAKAYGCVATPHVFIFDSQRKLRYRGQFDDSRFADASTVTRTDAANAVEALMAGQPVPVEITKPHGCSTKWIGKKESVAEQTQKWDQTPVEVALIDAKAAGELRKNGTPKLRLFNVWATWCGPCVAEFPELVKTARKYEMRDFELITLSADDPEDMGKVKAFLEKRGAGLSARQLARVHSEGRRTNSYLFQGANLEALMREVDPEWSGSIPHTVLVGTDGRVLWRHNGEVDGEELRAEVLKHLGVFYRP